MEGGIPTSVDFRAELDAVSGGPGGDAFPVGSVFIAVVATNPATLLGYGTWSAIAAGRMLVGLNSGDVDFDTAEETGGAKTHALTTAEIPAHTHTQNAHDHVLTQLRDAATGGATTNIALTAEVQTKQADNADKADGIRAKLDETANKQETSLKKIESNLTNKKSGP